MKFGFRKPSAKKSIKARTTGKVKRTVKKQVVPTYGKRGTGALKDPKKAAYNAAYSRTSIDTVGHIKDELKPKKTKTDISNSEPNKLNIDRLEEANAPVSRSRDLADKSADKSYVNISDSYFINNEIGTFVAHFELIPPQDGSSSKPKIRCSRDKRIVFELDAKSSNYNKLLKYEGRRKKITISRHKSNVDTGYYYKILL